MTFTVLSHAGLLIEHKNTQIICDPWLIGSCYWRSWWNFPEPPNELVSALKPDFIYLTHLHWDHFHGASLTKLFDLSTRVLVPKVPTRRMVRDLGYLGFRNVIEIPHGTPMQLGADLTLHSYQFGLGVDSAAVFSTRNTTLLDCNDCKTFGLPLRQITNRFPRIDFALRSHSSASPIPYCVDGYKERFPELRTQHDYIEEFSRFALSVGARYAIPFASNHCFLHRDTYHFNDTAVRPEAVRDRFRRLAKETNSDSECVVMTPGSTWSEEYGFKIATFDFSDSDAYIRNLRTKHQSTLDRQYEKEDKTRADFEAFSDYFTKFLAAIPWLVRRYLGFRVVFRTRDASGEHNWLVDMARNNIATLVDDRCDDCVVLETPALVLNDCATKNMFSVWTASKRLTIHLTGTAGLRTATTFFDLLDFYELETLPLSRNLSPRSIAVRWRRWREVVEVVRLIVRHKVRGRRFDIPSLYSLPGEKTGKNSTA